MPRISQTGVVTVRNADGVEKVVAEADLAAQIARGYVLVEESTDEAPEVENAGDGDSGASEGSVDLERMTLADLHVFADDHDIEIPSDVRRKADVVAYIAGELGLEEGGE